MEPKADFLIVGQGLAGSLLAWELLQRGCRVRVLDQPQAGAASRSSGGLVNPLAGKKFPAAWQVAETLPLARQTYAALEAQLGEQLWSDQPMLRVLVDEKQVPALDQAATDPTAGAYVGDRFAPGHWSAYFDDSLGSFLTAQSGWVDFELLVIRFRQWLEGEGMLVHAWPEDGTDLAETVVYCEGWRGQHNPHFSFVPWTPDRGLILHLELVDGEMPPYIVNRSEWLRPMGNGRFAAGATHGWDNFEQAPRENEVLALLNSIHSWTRARFKVIGATSGVRPAVTDRVPVVGRHPADPQRAIFNGLGGKAALPAPYLARLLARHLLDGTALPDSHSVARFWK
ncbi:MAG: FAD-dependent oxidoreductase [Verrucomicrobiota bacterium JB022]|nr:FAD-dependent oxidoreductase [Verrucomicrobiota bacterium JB022]